MRILALDSSTSVASIALVEFLPDSPPSLLYHYEEVHERTDSSAFFQGLEKAFLLGKKPERIIVGLGPGSYNGLRSSIAAAQGIASATGIPIYGIASALAFKEGGEGCWVVGDARGGHYWLAAVVKHQFLQEPTLLPPEEIAATLEKQPLFPLLGYSALSKLPLSLPMVIKTPSAFVLAMLGKEGTSQVALLEPLYLKSPHITPAKAKTF